MPNTLGTCCCTPVLHSFANAEIFRELNFERTEGGSHERANFWHGGEGCDRLGSAAQDLFAITSVLQFFSDVKKRR